MAFTTQTPLDLTSVIPEESSGMDGDFFLTYFTPILFSIIVIVGFLGNLLVILVIISNSQMRNTTNILIISLALADLAFIVFCVPFSALIYATKGWPLGLTMCRIYTFTVYFTAYCSVYTLALMSFDRFLAVVYPIESRTWRSQRNTIIAVVVVWTIFVFVNLYLFIRSQIVVVPGPNGTIAATFCTYRDLVLINTTTGEIGDNVRAGQMHFSFFFLFGYLMPLTVICVLYGIMIKSLLFGRTSKMSQSSEAMKSKRRVTKMVVIVIAIFALCWLPIHLVFLTQFFLLNIRSAWFRTVHVIANCMAYFNSMVNPILYAFLSDNFRRAFASFLCFGKFQNRRPSERFEQTTVRGLMKTHGVNKNHHNDDDSSDESPKTQPKAALLASPSVANGNSMLKTDDQPSVGYALPSNNMRNSETIPCGVVDEPNQLLIPSNDFDTSKSILSKSDTAAKVLIETHFN